jgi:hypothetical protein
MATSTLIDPTRNIGEDSTATFEADPKFTEPTPGSEGSSQNVEEQRDTDDVEESEEELDEDDEVEDDDVDEDDAFDDDEEEDEDEDEAVEDEEDLEDEEDDAEEVAAAPAMRADGLLGYEDEADDAEKGRSEEQGNAERARAEAKLKQPGSTRGTGRLTDVEGDDDAGDVAQGVREDSLVEDDMDTDRVTALAVDMLNWPAGSYNFGSYIGAQPTTFGTLQ